MTVRPLYSDVDMFVYEREKLIAIACRYVESPSVAEELVQESWLRWNAKSYQPDQVRPILLQIIRNLSIDWLRRQKTERSSLAEFAEHKDEAPDTERVVIARQQLRCVVHALQIMPERTRSAFRMRRLDNLTYKEIGHRLGTSEAGAYRLVADGLFRVIVEMNDA